MTNPSPPEPTVVCLYCDKPVPTTNYKAHIEELHSHLGPSVFEFNPPPFEDVIASTGELLSWHCFMDEHDECDKAPVCMCQCHVQPEEETG